MPTPFIGSMVIFVCEIRGRLTRCEKNKKKTEKDMRALLTTRMPPNEWTEVALRRCGFFFFFLQEIGQCSRKCVVKGRERVGVGSGMCVGEC